MLRADPFQFTTEPLMKLLPFTVTVSAPAPAVALLGVSEVSTGRGFGALIVKTTAPETPPPGPGFTTVICAVPAAAMSAAVTAVCNCVALTSVVAGASRSTARRNL